MNKGTPPTAPKALAGSSHRQESIALLVQTPARFCRDSRATQSFPFAALKDRIRSTSPSPYWTRLCVEPFPDPNPFRPCKAGSHEAYRRTIWTSSRGRSSRCQLCGGHTQNRFRNNPRVSRPFGHPQDLIVRISIREGISRSGFILGQVMKMWESVSISNSGIVVGWMLELRR